MKKTELIFIPSPGIGHLTSSIEMAKLLTKRNQSISITILLMKFPMDNSKVNPYSSDSTTTNTIQFIDLPPPDISSLSPSTFFPQFVESHKTHVRDAVAARSKLTHLAGFVIDMFCTTMIDVADEFGLPTYVFFTSSASFLNLTLHVQNLVDNENVKLESIKDRNDDLIVPGFANRVPTRVLPMDFFDIEGGFSDMFLYLARRFKETKGIIINTFYELESYAIDFISLNKPIYTVGPVLNLNNEANSHKSYIINWLDEQPESSVIFLCFGSMGSFNEAQVKEIAKALERIGCRFIWSLRRPMEKGKIEFPGEFPDLTKVLPDGFLERTERVGQVVGWAPQVSVLSHKSVGGFVSHCGWNSVLEGVWYGVPIATWPMYAEQQINAFQLLKELGLGVEIKMDYKKDFKSMSVGDDEIVSGEVIECGIRKLMEEVEVRKKVGEMEEMSRIAVSENGSSYNAIGCLIEDIMKNVHDV